MRLHSLIVASAGSAALACTALAVTLWAGPAAAATWAAFGWLALSLLALLLAVRQRERGHAEVAQRLRDGDDQHRLVLNAINEGVMLFSAEGRVLDCNPAAERLLSRTEAQLRGAGVASWDTRGADGQRLAPDDRPLARALRSGLALRNQLIADVAPDGRTVWLNVNVEPMRERASGRASGAVVSFSDVTEYRLAFERRTRELEQAVAARLEVESFAQTITDHQPTLLTYIDSERVLRFANLAAQTWFGVSRDEVVGQPIHNMPAWNIKPPDSALVDRVLGGEAFGSAEDLVSRSGKVGHFWVYRLPHHREGRVVGYYFIATDVTALRQTEQLLRATNAELVLARDRAEAGMRSKSAFLANMSHEIRTPLNAVIGLTHLLRRDTDEPRTGARLDSILEAAQQLLHTVDNVLDLAKLGAGRLSLSSAAFSPAALLAACRARVAEAAQRKGLALSVDAGALPRLLHGDAARLQQALACLLDNAVKFTEHGSVALRASTEPSSQPGLLLRFEVSDSGPGIAPERLGSIFDAFEQADGSSTRRVGGSGMGLALTRQLAQLMGGDCGVDSAVGSGSRFWFSARLQAAAVESGSEAEDAAASPLAGKRVLLVAPSPSARAHAAGLLGGLGMAVTEAADAEEALALARAAEAAGAGHELVLIDWALSPAASGFDTARRLQDQAGALMPAIAFASAEVDEGMRSRALQLGVTTLLRTPLVAATLREELAALLLFDLPAAADLTAARAAELTAEQGLRERHGGAHVLLVEDNPLSQEVASGLLRLAGFELVLAGDGRAAVDAVQARRYDLILMDMQMPGMDGLQATRAIRRLPNGAQVPIIAMTANAFAEDRSACLAAGMNDHLGKPIEPLVLYDVLGHWLAVHGVAQRAKSAPAAPPATTTTTATATAAAAPGAADLRLQGIATATGIAVARGLAFFAGRTESYLQALDLFATMYANGLPALKPFVDQPGPAGAAHLQRDVHSLGGAAAAIGAEAVQREAMAIDARLRGGSGCADELAALRALDGALRALVERLRAATPSAP